MGAILVEPITVIDSDGKVIPYTIHDGNKDGKLQVATPEQRAETGDLISLKGRLQTQDEYGKAIQVIEDHIDMPNVQRVNAAQFGYNILGLTQAIRRKSSGLALPQNAKVEFITAYELRSTTNPAVRFGNKNEPVLHANGEVSSVTIIDDIEVLVDGKYLPVKTGTRVFFDESGSFLRAEPAI